MRSLVIALAFFVLTPAAALAQQGDAAPKAAPELKTDREKAFYAIGVNIGESLRRSGVASDLKILVRGLSDAFTGAKPALTPEEIQQGIATFQNEAGQKQVELAKAQSEKNKTAGAAFHADNKKKEGVVTL